MKLSYLARVLVIALAVLLSVPSSFAQSGRGTMTGTVTDASGAIVPDAEITLINKANGEQTKAKTTSTGLFAHLMWNLGPTLSRLL